LTGKVDPSACFLANLACWVSYLLIAVASLFVILILWWIYKKCCAKNDDAAKNNNDNSNYNKNGPSPVDLALMGAGGGNSSYQQQQYNNRPTAPASPPKGKYELLAEQMKTMTPRELSQTLRGGGEGGTSTPALVSPSARYIDASMQQISPRQAPIFTDDDL
jgi:hypothetical protein